MNKDKTRELFSDYREGLLNPSQLAGFEAALAADPELRQEYAEFDAAVGSLEHVAVTSVEVPFDLHERIMARLDKSIFEERRRSKVGWLGGWRLGVTGGVAAIAIVATLVSINSGGAGRVNTGEIIGVPARVGLTLENRDGQLVLKHTSARGRRVLVKDEESGKLVQRFDLEGRALESPQQNDGERSVLLRIESVGSSETLDVLVATPGKKSGTALTGSGTMAELALALADTYREPVQVEATDLEAKVAWSFELGEATHARATSGKFSVERRRGLLYLVD